MKSKFLIAALSLTALLGLGKGTAAAAEDQSLIVNPHTVTFQPDKPAGEPEQWTSCGVYRDDKGNLQRDPVFDAGAIVIDPWMGGVVFRNIGGYPVTMAARNPNDTTVEAGVIARDGSFTVRLCKTDPQTGDLLTCSREKNDSLKDLAPVLGHVNNATEQVCAVFFKTKAKTLSAKQKAKIAVGGLTHPAVFTDMLKLIHDGPKQQ